MHYAKEFYLYSYLLLNYKEFYNWEDFSLLPPFSWVIFVFELCGRMAKHIKLVYWINQGSQGHKTQPILHAFSNALLSLLSKLLHTA